jgi:2OG-Fe(II) oxygenase superfamily
MDDGPAHLQLTEFLTAEEIDRLRAFAAARDEQMKPSTVTPEGERAGRQKLELRRSHVDWDINEIWPLFEDRLRGLLPHVRRELGISHFALGDIARELTRHADGDFFGLHRDEFQPWTDRCRMVSFVYYFGLAPREFEGGELRLYGPGGPSAAGSDEPGAYVEIQPEPNSIVFFASSLPHEVMPVRSTGDGAGAIRWSVNGWFLAGDLGRPRVPKITRAVRNLISRRLLPAVAPTVFSLRPTPDAVNGLLKGLWELERAELRPEEIDPEYVSGGTPDLLPLGPIGGELLAHLQPLHEQWAGVSLIPVQAYGLRVFRRGQTLEMHVEPLTTHLVSSMLVVAQDADRPWPLRFDTRASSHRLFPQPGQMVLYQGAAVPHGHPTPLEGEAFVVVTLHYRPLEAPAGWPVDGAALIAQALAEGLIDDRGQVTEIGPGLNE